MCYDVNNTSELRGSVPDQVKVRKAFRSQDRRDKLPYRNKHSGCGGLTQWSWILKGGEVMSMNVGPTMGCELGRSGRVWVWGYERLHLKVWR